MMLSVWLAVFVLLGVCDAQDLGVNSTSDLEEEVNFTVDNGPPYRSNIKSLQELCSAQHVVSCLKMWLVNGLGRLARRPSLELLPGLTVKGDMSALQDLPKDISEGHLDEALLHSLARYLGTLSLTVRVMDSGVVQRLQDMGQSITQESDNEITGRRKRYGSAMMMAGMMSGGTMMALGMSAIAAMAGKALMTALLSLMLSALSSMKGGGGGVEKTTYEIIHAGHDSKHRSIEAAVAEADSSGAYPYYLPQPAARRNLIIPLNRR